MELTHDRLLDTYRTMRTIRSFEQTLNELSQAGRVPGFLHLYAGEEAIASGVCALLSDEDYVTSTHRGHGHSIAKGVDLNAMMAEIFGKTAGVCKGKGGSMHIADVGKGMLGANGIVGGGIPLAIGAALAAKVKKTGGVAVAFFGDGATNQGAFHESVNIASILKLPVLFVIENNGYGEATPVEYHVNIRDLAARAASYGIPGVIADGMDFFDVFGKASTAVERARRGEGPTLMECKTYRYFGHYIGDPLTYRTKEDTEKVRTTRDPIDSFEKRVVRDGTLATSELRAADDQVAKAIADAVRFAEASAAPDVAELLTDVYVDYPG
ncbi:MAG TPA: thiamine pyrophosphate-dependent dehydrogenase E1 component subunit alpha [Candidatus Binatia bacterium]|nr:thiamine pyrophosphate-dependent dehydrogenase E1 component subunit alpha [Candidatus Binatia bacterium]